MYKVFKENTTFILAKSENLISIDQAITIYIDKPISVIEIMENMGNNNDKNVYIIYCNKYKKTIETLEKHFPIKIAAGGWTYNEYNSLLMIKRLDFWDIPKGHLEKGETLEECAIREVEEETGVEELEIQEKLGITRHLIKRRDGFFLKVNHWYRMKSNFEGKLKPQKNEDITKAKWIEVEFIDKYMRKSWLSLQDFYYEIVLKPSLIVKD